MTQAEHVQQLADRFNVRLDIRPGMSITAAAMGWVGVICPKCKRTNRLTVPNQPIRCGACKEPLGIFPVTQYVQVPPVTNDKVYAAALHELGHCVAPLGTLFHHFSQQYRSTRQCYDMRDARLVIEVERAAWDWARHYALDWTPTMEQVRVTAFGTYAAEGRRLGVKL